MSYACFYRLLKSYYPAFFSEGRGVHQVEEERREAERGRELTNEVDEVTPFLESPSELRRERGLL